jgi:hypothetical protein
VSANAPTSNEAAANQPEERQTWMCRWERVHGPVVDGRAQATVVWICEHPYRTMLSARPEQGSCAGCPALERTACPAA